MFCCLWFLLYSKCFAVQCSLSVNITCPAHIFIVNFQWATHIFLVNVLCTQIYSGIKHINPVQNRSFKWISCTSNIKDMVTSFLYMTLRHVLIYKYSKYEGMGPKDKQVLTPGQGCSGRSRIFEPSRLESYKSWVLHLNCTHLVHCLSKWWFMPFILALPLLVLKRIFVYLNIPEAHFKQIFKWKKD